MEIMPAPDAMDECWMRSGRQDSHNRVALPASVTIIEQPRPMASHGVPMGHSMGFTKADTWEVMGKGDGPGMLHGGVRHACPGHHGAMGFPMGTMPSLSWKTMGSQGPTHGRVMGRDGEWTETTRVERHEAMAAGRASELAMARAGGMAPLAGRRTLQRTTPRVRPRRWSRWWPARAPR